MLVYCERHLKNFFSEDKISAPNGRIQAHDTSKMSELDLGSFTHPSISQVGGKYWFYEKDEQSFPGQSFGLEIEKILHHTHSKYQDILIFRSTKFGNVLVLNGIIQCTERDEFAYQELITHVPIMSHTNPEKILVIGGGDCGVIREVIKHVEMGTVKEVTMVEIDDMVIKLSAKYLPQMAKFNNDPRVKIIIDDGFEYLKSLQTQSNKYDVIITDSSDPEGPAEEFFKVNYFNLLLNALNENGIVIMQSSENIWLNINYLKNLLVNAKQVFHNVRYLQCYMPLYTSGQLGLIVATNDCQNDLSSPQRSLPADKQSQFKYYNSAVHQASFVLPNWANSLLNN